MLMRLLILQIGFFLVLILALKKLFHGHLLEAIKRMEKLQDQNRKKEEELARYQEMVMEDCKVRIRELDAQLHEREAKAEEEIKAIRQLASAELERERQTLLENVRKKEQLLEQHFENDVEKKGALIACELIQNSFSEEMFKALHEQLTEELLASLPSSALPAAISKEKSIKVRSAYPLTETQKKRIAPSAVIHEQVDKSLTAGFVILLGQLVLDGSLKNQFEKQLSIRGKKS